MILDTALRTSFGNVIGDQSILFGAAKNFHQLQCCDDAKAFDGHPNRIDLVIALDESGSVNFENFSIMKTFVEDIASHFVVSCNATRVAVVTWSTGVTCTLEFDFDQYINNEGVKEGIKRIRYSGGGTANGDALNLIQRSLFSQSPPNAKKVLFIITNTDGRSNNQTYNLSTEANHLKNSGVEIFTFGIGSSVHDPELTAIASLPTETHKFRLETFGDLSALSNLIASKLVIIVVKC